MHNDSTNPPVPLAPTVSKGDAKFRADMRRAIREVASLADDDCGRWSGRLWRALERSAHRTGTRCPHELATVEAIHRYRVAHSAYARAVRMDARRRAIRELCR